VIAGVRGRAGGPGSPGRQLDGWRRRLAPGRGGTRTHLLVVAGHVLCRDDHLRTQRPVHPRRDSASRRQVLQRGGAAAGGSQAARARMAHLHLVRGDLVEAGQLPQRLAILVLQHGDARVCSTRAGRGACANRVAVIACGAHDGVDRPGTGQGLTARRSGQDWGPLAGPEGAGLQAQPNRRHA
jgi:hypothetical protein